MPPVQAPPSSVRWKAPDGSTAAAGWPSRPASATRSSPDSSSSTRRGWSAVPALRFCAGLSASSLLDLVDLGAEAPPDRGGRGLAGFLHRLARALAAAGVAGAAAGREAMLGKRRERRSGGDGDELRNQRALQQLDERLAGVEAFAALGPFAARRRPRHRGSGARSVLPSARRAAALAAVLRRRLLRHGI